MSVPTVRLRGHRRWLALAVILAAFAVTVTTAMRQTSTTFDEILLPAAGARGFQTGQFDLITLYHPPLTQYLYGAAVALHDFRYPLEPEAAWAADTTSFLYARAFYFSSGNDPERLAFVARLVSATLGVLLVLTAFLFTSGAAGAGAGLLAAVLVAFIPDVLAHSGISYNDIALALAFFLAIWAADAAIRDPRPARAALCGLALAGALAVKFSAIAIGPVGLVLVLLEMASRRLERAWLRRLLLVALPVVLVSAYATLVLIYRGDFLLEQFRAGLLFNIQHADRGHGAPAVLLGRQSTTGWWYFFPVAFFLKTSAGLHVLLAIALASLLLPTADRHGWRLAGARLRAPVAGAVVFLGFVMASKLNIGFRHALPIVPLVCVLIASGAARMWSQGKRHLRLLIAAAVLWHVVAPLRFYPFFLSYRSEYTGPAEFGYETFVDSSYDWGQGLLALREFMRAERIPVIYLSYFGSALPGAYGIDYVPLPSFFLLPPQARPSAAPPQWAAISATNLAGNYFNGDPFARFREIQPYRIVGGSIFVFRIADDPAPTGEAR